MPSSGPFSDAGHHPSLGGLGIGHGAILGDEQETVQRAVEFA